MVDDEKQEVSRSSITPHLLIPVTKHLPVYSARFSIQAGFWDRVFLVWYTRCLTGRRAYHGSRPGRCGFEGLCEAVQGEDRREEEASPIAVGPSSGLCVFDGIGEREGEAAGGQGKSAGGVEGLEGGGEDGIAACRSTTRHCRSKCVDPLRLSLVPCLL